MKFSLKFALLGLLLLAAVTNCAKKKGKGKADKKSKSGSSVECPAEIKSDNKNYPHQLTVTVNELLSSRTCGGTWLSEDVVITAGHCVTDKKDKALKPGSLSVATGTRTQALLRSVEMRTVAEVQLHPDFKRVTKAGKDETAYYANDVAVLKLAKPGMFANKKAIADMEGKYAVLPKGKDAVSEGVEVGFLTPAKGLLEFKSVLLWERAIKIVDKAECAKSEELKDAKADVEAGKTICGDILEKCEKYEESCDRQTGGGLICKGDKDVLCGIQTTHHCDEEERPPQTYLNVAEYKDWISKKISAMGGEDEDDDE